jgi:hypothetical protein
MGNFMKYSHSKAMAVFYKIVKLAKEWAQFFMVEKTERKQKLLKHKYKRH